MRVAGLGRGPAQVPGEMVDGGIPDRGGGVVALDEPVA
jgi:hypothetical protein